MKILKFIGLLSFFTFILYGCGSRTVAYKDGVYDISHNSTKSGYEEALVTVQSGIIKNIELRRLDAKGVEVNYDQWTGAGEYPNLKQDRITLANAMLAKQSQNVDSISGATESSIGWKTAVAVALKQAQK